MNSEHRLATFGSADPAVHTARAVVGLYGDPGVSWSIMLDFELSRAVDIAEVDARLAQIVRANLHLGRPPALAIFGPGEVADVLLRFANEPYGNQDPLVRFAVSESGDRVILGVHHGAMDGLGMLSTLNQVLDIGFVSSARGIPDVPARTGFMRSSVLRLWEAALRPPRRFRRSVSPQVAHDREGDWLVSGEVETRHPTTSGLVVATRSALDRWNEDGPDARKPVVLAMGASRRSGDDELRPDRATAYVRVDATGIRTTQQAREVLLRTPPEPDFPVTRGLGVGPLVTRALSSRLGSTALVSNLGRLTGSDLVRRAHLWPAASGPSGVAIGLVTVENTTVLTLRARRADFDRGAASRLHGALAARLSALD